MPTLLPLSGRTLFCGTRSGAKKRLKHYAKLRKFPDVNSSSPSAFSAPGRAPIQAQTQAATPTQTAPPQKRKKLTPRQAAIHADISIWTVYRLFHGGLIEGERPGPNTIRIYEDSLQAHLQATKDPEFWA